MRIPTAFVACVAAAVLAGPGQARAQRARFGRPALGEHHEVWRLTHDPVVRDWANYHNCNCWSPDGRYVCYTHWGAKDDNYGSKSGASVHVFDLERDTDLRVDQGINPRWAKTRNSLFYVRFDPSKGELPAKGTEVRRFDPDTGENTHFMWGVEMIGGTDYRDEWLYGARRFRGQTPQYRSLRMSMSQPDAFEDLPNVVGSQMLPNPEHPVLFTRSDHKKEPFNATRYWYPLDGRERKIFVPTLQQCHMAWLGNGEYFLLGNGLIRGRRWNEPFPSNVHILASVGVGDVSPCGRSGRYACGDHTVADLRSGDGWRFIDPLSIVCYPREIADNSGIYDADPKGSPDGTKISFVSNYDLQNAPVATIAETPKRGATALVVDSTDGFPPAGYINVRREVIRYERKTAKSFGGLTRQCFDTVKAPLRAGRRATSFASRRLTDEEWTRMGRASSSMRHSIKDESSPLIRQRQTDVYVAVVRRPDRPYLRRAGSGLQLVPGEAHYETRGYHLLRDGQRITTALARPGAVMALPGRGEYRAVAVEWSGLESEPSLPLQVARPAKLNVLTDAPKDFSWTRDRWLVNGKETPRQAAGKADEAIREILHLHDGVIHREWYRRGVIAKRHDLSADGKAIRRLTFDAGRLAVREYYNREDFRVSREVFDENGFITEWLFYRHAGRGVQVRDHWFYDRGMPVRHVLKERDHFEKRGDHWVKVGRPQP